jgi:hypothetical protein
MRIGVICLVAACYSPHPQAGAPCVTDQACPDPLVCIGMQCEPPGTVLPDATSHADAPPADAPTDSPRLPDAPPDSPPLGPMIVQQAMNHAEQAASLSVTFTSPPTPGNLLVMIGAANGGQLSGVTGAAALWSHAADNVDNANVEIWYAIADGTGSMVTVTRAGNTNAMWASISEWSGMAAASPLDNAGANGGLSGTASVPPINTAHAHDLLIFGVADTQPGVSYGTPNPGMWTAMNTVATTDFLQASWYRLVVNTGGYNASVSAQGTGWDAALAAFKAAN